MDNQANQNNQNPVNPVGPTDPNVNPVVQEPSQVQQPITDPIAQTAPQDPGSLPFQQAISQDPITTDPISQQPVVQDPVVQQPDVVQSAVSNPASQPAQDPITPQPLISQEPVAPAPLDPQPIVQPVQPEVAPIISDSTTQQSTAGQLTQQQEDAMVDMLMDKVFARIGQMLTEDEMKQVEELDKTDFNGEAVRQFLQGKGIDIDKIMQEEMEKLKEEASNSTAGN